MHVKVKLKTIISDDHDREQLEVSANGQYIEKEGTIVLIFTERGEDGNQVKNMVTIAPDKVSVKRTGHIRMHQIFRENKVTESTYYHPFGIMRMETETKQIQFIQNKSSLKTNGRIEIDYLLRLNDHDPVNHRLILAYEGKEK
jgi:uncharacterized beta-barrel protein YwiB (DUF1934 family)